MLSMIRYGANHVFSAKEGEYTDQDIDAILAEGEKRTLDQKNRLEQLGENQLRKFTIDAAEDINSNSGDGFNLMESISCYVFEGEDYREKRANPEFIMPPKRERRPGTYSYGGGALYTHQGKNIRVPKPPKQPVLYDFQFYPKRLFDLNEKEMYYYRRTIGLKTRADDIEDDSNSGSRQTREQKKIEEAQPLSEEEQEERKRLLTEGFGSWSRREFNQFVKANEKYGRYNMTKICDEVDGKTADEVKQYAQVFWERHEELQDSTKIILQIQKGENKIKRKKFIKRMLDHKMAKYERPLEQLKFQYGSGKGKNFTEQEDRFLIYHLHRLGFDNENVYDDILQLFRYEDAFRFDWYIKSRTPADLKSRCNHLIVLLEKEYEDEELKNGRQQQKVRRSKRALARSKKRSGKDSCPDSATDETGTNEDFKKTKNK
ncbi:hypothetical protein ACOME3_000813 [Neoechinorhynchus agilis]